MFVHAVVVELDTTVAEVLDLAQREAHFFLSVAIAVEATADGGSELVGVADAVNADEAVAREEPVPGETAFVAVEVGDVALVFVGGVEVIKARFEGLCPAFAAPVEVALEVEFAVDRQSRQGAGFVFSGEVLFVFTATEVVVGEIRAHFGFEIAVGSFKTVGNGSVCAQAVGTAEVVFVEAHGFGAEIVTPVAVLQAVVVGKLRQAGVGFVRFANVAIDALVFLSAQHEVAVAGVAVEGGVAFEVPVVVETEVGGEVFNVIYIGDALLQEVGAPFFVEAVLVGATPAPARVFWGLSIVRQQAAVEGAFLFFAEEAVFSLSHEAAFGHGAQGEGGVLVWRDVPVVRNADFESARFAAAQ